MKALETLASLPITDVVDKMSRIAACVLVQVAAHSLFFIETKVEKKALPEDGLTVADRLLIIMRLALFQRA
jgi:hypothetical protein